MEQDERPMLGNIKQRITPTMSRTMEEESLNYLEGFTPFQYDGKSGMLLRGNIPQEVYEDNWESLNQQVSLGNFGPEDVGTVYLMTKRNTMTMIKTIPRDEFGVHALRRLQQVKTGNFLLSTKSKNEGDRDRKLIPALVNLQETKGSFKDDSAAQTKSKRWGGMLNPMNWMM